MYVVLMCSHLSCHRHDQIYRDHSGLQHEAALLVSSQPEQSLTCLLILLFQLIHLFYQQITWAPRSKPRKCYGHPSLQPRDNEGCWQILRYSSRNIFLSLPTVCSFFLSLVFRCPPFNLLPSASPTPCSGKPLVSLNQWSSCLSFLSD